uniref:Putative secreted protein n=1 Tax=Ixodes ricinus TaxID=34613 RepID=A0A6B0TYY5_IXORI
MSVGTALFGPLLFVLLVDGVVGGGTGWDAGESTASATLSVGLGRSVSVAVGWKLKVGELLTALSTP